jgi:VWFA-related protein
MLKFIRIGALVLGFVSLVLVMSIAQTQKTDPRQGINAPIGQQKQEMSPESGNEQFDVKVNVDLVTADVTVVGENIPELRAEDFAIYDNGVAQQISHFSQDQLPLAVAIVVDNAVVDNFEMLKIAALSALRHLKPEDEVALFAFAHDCHALNKLTKDRVSVSKAVVDLDVKTFREKWHEKWGGQNVYGALYEVARYLKREAPSHRRAMIVMTGNSQISVSGERTKRRGKSR